MSEKEVKHTPEQQNAIDCADAWLRAVGLPTHSELRSSVSESLPPTEVTGEMWSAGRSAFITWAQRYEDAKTSDAASVIADVAGAEIFRAMLARATS